MKTDETKTPQKHTPGPWVVANGLQVWKSGHNTVASPRICTLKNAAHPVEQISAEEQKANASLIAAAPELLEALQAYHALHAPAEGRFPSAADTPAGVAYAKALAAIAKAEGRQP